MDPNSYAQVQDQDFLLSPQPWRYLSWGSLDVTRLVRIAPPPPHKLILPEVYGRPELPLADAPIKDVYEQKPLDLNRFGRCYLLPGNVALRPGPETTVLNPSFFFGRHKLHGFMRRSSPEEESFYYARELSGPPNYLKTPVYFADADQPHVYGHVLFDAIARCWAYGFVPKGTPLATTIKINRTYAKMLEALDIDPWSVVRIDRPTVAPEVYFPGIAFGRRDGVYPQAFEVYSRIARLRKQSEIITRDRIYISRSGVPLRKLLQEREMEQWFESQGFAIVHPEKLKIEDQIALFANARMIAGPAGSAMHNAVFSPPETRILIVASSGWLHVADIFISQVAGRLGYVFGDPLTAPTEGHRERGDWSVDMADVIAGAKAHFGI